MSDSDLTGSIIDFESGILSPVDTVRLFARLVKTGMAWSLQGSYGRTAKSLMEEKWLSESGEILRLPCLLCESAGMVRLEPKDLPHEWECPFCGAMYCDLDNEWRSGNGKAATP